MPGLGWNSKTNTGATPLYWALKEGASDCVNIIVTQPGVDFTAKTNAGESLTEVAVTSTQEQEEGQSLKCVKILADVDGVDWNAEMSIGRLSQG